MSPDDPRHGTYTGYTRWRCRCDACSEAPRRYKAGRAMGPDDPRHGTVNGYNNLRCRCEPCREAWRTYPPMKEAYTRYRRRRGIQPQKLGRTHGLRSTYVGGCRCDACRAAEAAWKRGYRARQRAQRVAS